MTETAKPEVSQAMGSATNSATTGATIFVLTRTIWWRDLLSYPHPDHDHDGYMVPDTVPALSRKEREVAVWQFGSATRRESASRSRDSFVNCPGEEAARARAILVLRTAQSSSHRGYSTFRRDVVMISERRKSARRPTNARLTMCISWTATTTFSGSELWPSSLLIRRGKEYSQRKIDARGHQDESTKLPSECNVFMDKELQIQPGRCPLAVSTDGWPLGTFTASF